MNTAIRVNPEDAAKQKAVQKEIMQVSDDVRKRHGWLRHQNAIGLAIFTVSIAGVLLNAWLYGQNLISAWLVIPLTAFWTSLLHELEHDLIHWMYFRKNRLMHHLMMLGVYIFRPTTINPWIRRHLHFRHHKISGTETDLEERAITNGEKWGPRRLLMTGDNMLAFYLRAVRSVKEVARLYNEGAISKRELWNLRLIAAFGYFPIGVAAYAIWHFFVAYHAVNGIAWLANTSVAWPAMVEAQMGWLTFAVVTLVGPNVLRTFCLHFISSNMHYYGDVEAGNVMQQCQVLNKWWLAPLQLFCFNFGSTHAIHHFVVRDPFYLRQMTAKKGHEILRHHGVRFNDLGTFRRANRWSAEPVPEQRQAIA